MVKNKENKVSKNAKENPNKNQTKLKSKVNDVELEIEELKNKHLRLFAEFENYKKRTSRERIDLYKNAGIEFFESILTVLDDFDRAIKHEKSEKNGLKLIYSKMKNIFEQKGLKEMESSVNKDFNTDFHEAITQINAPNKKLIGKIIEETEKGYLLNDKVIRYAKVVVGK